MVSSMEFMSKDSFTLKIFVRFYNVATMQSQMELGQKKLEVRRSL